MGLPVLDVKGICVKRTSNFDVADRVTLIKNLAGDKLFLFWQISDHFRGEGKRECIHQESSQLVRSLALQVERMCQHIPTNATEHHITLSIVPHSLRCAVTFPDLQWAHSPLVTTAVCCGSGSWPRQSGPWTASPAGAPPLRQALSVAAPPAPSTLAPAAQRKVALHRNRHWGTPWQQKFTEEKIILRAHRRDGSLTKLGTSGSGIANFDHA